MRVINDEFASNRVPVVHPSKRGQRRVTFSDNLVQYSTNSDDIQSSHSTTTEGAQKENNSVEEEEELSDTELDSSIYSDFDWTEDLLDSIPDSEEEEAEEKEKEIFEIRASEQTTKNTEETESENMLYEGVIGLYYVLVYFIIIVAKPIH